MIYPPPLLLISTSQKASATNAQQWTNSSILAPFSRLREGLKLEQWLVTTPSMYVHMSVSAAGTFCRKRLDFHLPEMALARRASSPWQGTKRILIWCVCRTDFLPPSSFLWNSPKCSPSNPRPQICERPPFGGHSNAEIKRYDGVRTVHHLETGWYCHWLIYLRASIDMIWRIVDLGSFQGIVHTAMTVTTPRKTSSMLEHLLLSSSVQVSKF